MKNIIAATFSLLIISVFFISCGPSSEEAAKYNDALIAQEAMVLNAERELVTALTKNMSTALIDTAYNKLVKQLKTSTDSVKGAGMFDGATLLKDALLELFTTYNTVTEKDYTEIIQLNKISDTLTTMAEDFDKKIEITDRIDSILNGAVDKFDKVHSEFAKKYRLEFTEKDQGVTEEKKK
ncbi:MAG: hypothetical protein V1904_10100 [Bacteroidota bacterium]